MSSVTLEAPTARVILPAGAPRQTWLDARTAGVGGSDVAAILGLDTRRGPLHVYLDKRGELEEQRSAQLDRSARRGNRLEGLVAELFEEETGLPVATAPGMFQHVDRPWMIANPDRIVDGTGILECKTRTWRSAQRENWDGEEAPDGPALQAYWYRAVTGYRSAFVAGLVDDEFRQWQLPDDTELIDHLVEYVTRWWHEHVVAGVPPKVDGSKATTELLAHLWQAKPEAITEVDEGEALILRARLAELEKQAAAVKTELARVKNRMAELIGTGEIAMADGRELFTRKANGTFASSRFAAAHPEIVAAHQMTVSVPDWDAIKTKFPQEYRAHRARVLRVPKDNS
jgi:putative phage-type endonuclease